MVTSPLESLARIGPPERGLELRRAWPRGSDHLLLEYAAPDGTIVAGQWFADAARLRDALHETTTTLRGQSESGRIAGCGVAEATAEHSANVLLQSGGADRRLHGLVPLLGTPGARLLVHQPERRAVVRLEGAGGLCYAKVVRPGRVAAVVDAGQAASELAGTAFDTPRPIEYDDASGVVVWSALQGVSLYDLLGGDRMVAGARVAGTALRRLHRAAAGPALRIHGAAEELAVLETWIERASSFAPALGEHLSAAAPRVTAMLGGGTSPHVPLHRDFYDKQVFVDGEQAGVLDFDTLAQGEAALDVANAAVHFELRALQGRCTAEQAAEAAEAFLDAYAPDRAVRARIPAYAAAARLRLACVYLFRPRWHACIPALLERLTPSPVGETALPAEPSAGRA